MDLRAVRRETKGDGMSECKLEKDCWRVDCLLHVTGWSSCTANSEPSSLRERKGSPIGARGAAWLANRLSRSWTRREVMARKKLRGVVIGQTISQMNKLSSSLADRSIIFSCPSHPTPTTQLPAQEPPQHTSTRALFKEHRSRAGNQSGRDGISPLRSRPATPLH